MVVWLFIRLLTQSSMIPSYVVESGHDFCKSGYYLVSNRLYISRSKSEYSLTQLIFSLNGLSAAPSALLMFT